MTKTFTRRMALGALVGATMLTALPAMAIGRLADVQIVNRDSGITQLAQLQGKRLSLTDPVWLPQAVAVAAQQIAAHTFSASVWQRDRERQIAAWQEAQNQPDTHAARAFDRAVYGTHPYGQEETPQTWRAISVNDGVSLVLATRLSSV